MASSPPPSPRSLRSCRPSRRANARPFLELGSDGVVWEAPPPRGDDGPAAARRRPGGQENILADATLADAERQQLHVDIYAYLRWLYGRLKESDSCARRRFGINVAGLENLLNKFEDAFDGVRDEKKRDAVAREYGEGGAARATATPVPFLEEGVQGELQRRVRARQGREARLWVAARVARAAAAAAAAPARAPSFDRLFSALREYRQRHGHVDVPVRYKHRSEQGDLDLGEWVADLRRRKRSLRARELEVEPSDHAMTTLPISRGRLGVTLQFATRAFGAEITEVAPACTFKDSIAAGDRLMAIDGKLIAKPEDLALGKEKAVRQFQFAKKCDSPSTYLSIERTERLASIDFQWIGKANEKKSWDERFRKMVQYKEEHGKFPMRKTKGIGDWMNEQRKNHRRKDGKFMRERAPKLEAVGFPWAIHRAKRVRWEDHYERLVAFWAMNRHFNVPQPKKEDYAGDEKGFEDAACFSKWERSLHAAYRANLKGTDSRSRLTEERLGKLRGIGFQFEEERRRRHMTGGHPDPDEGNGDADSGCNDGGSGGGGGDNSDNGNINDGDDDSNTDSNNDDNENGNDNDNDDDDDDDDDDNDNGGDSAHL